jgi:hypothetical protein
MKLAIARDLEKQRTSGGVSRQEQRPSLTALRRVPHVQRVICGTFRERCHQAFCRRQIANVHSDRACRHHWFSPVMAATILRMTGAASSTMGRTATHDSSHDRSQSPRNVLRDSEECAIAAATADVSPDWITPKMKGALRFGSLNK